MYILYILYIFLKNKYPRLVNVINKITLGREETGKWPASLCSRGSDKGSFKKQLTKSTITQTNLKSAGPNNYEIIATICNEGTCLSIIKRIEFNHMHIIFTIHSISSVSTRLLLHFQWTKSKYHGSDIFSRVNIYIPTKKDFKSTHYSCAWIKKCKRYLWHNKI